MRNKKKKSAADDFDDKKSVRGYPRRSTEISGDEEGDPIWKPSNTNETGGRRRRETAENPKLSLTCSLFELETPDFA